MAKKGEDVFQFGQCLKFKKNNKSFLVVNVHLNGGKTDKDDAIRVEQVNEMTNFLKKEECRPFPVIIAGDFNHEVSEAEKKLKAAELKVASI